jgi:TolA-binding protein
MKRAIIWSAALLVGLVGSRARAQSTSPADTTNTQSYSDRRKAILDDIKSSQRKLDDLRVERLQLESRVEAVAGKVAEQRVNTLLMSRETYALRQLDSLLTVSQDVLLAQRDRFLTLGDAVRRRAGAELVIVFRADSAPTAQHIDSVTVRIDDGAGTGRHYSLLANSALANGAVDELYRSNVLPSPHDIMVVVALNGLPPQAKSVRVDAAAGASTYVQFAVRNGLLVQTTWSNRDASSPPSK